MPNRLLSIIATILGLTTLYSCGESNSFTPEYDYSSVVVTSFKLKANDSVLTKLDTVFFAIDLDKAVIFNPDSLPKGTKIDKLVIEPSFVSVAEAKIVMPLKNGTDTIFDYTTSSTDSLDFSNGPVILRLTSLDYTVTRDYAIHVNVHTIEPDSLTWDAAEMRTLPGHFTGATANATVRSGDKIYSVSAAGSAATVAVASVSDVTGQWNQYNVTLPADADLSTLTADENGFYLVASGALYKSDDCNAWNSTGVAMNHIYGIENGTLLGAVKHTDGDWYHKTYPETTESPVTPGCPIGHTSQMTTYTTEWSTQPMSMFTGGVCSDGSFSGDTWAWDGQQWNSITDFGLPAIKGVTVFPYFTFRLNDAWIANERPTLLAIGGMFEDGSMNTTTYISFDRGVHWQYGGELLQMPGYIEPRYGADALVLEHTNTDIASAWSKKSPSRIIKPISEWDTPYVYLFGGYGQNGDLYNQLWRGVINRLEFKPVE